MGCKAVAQDEMLLESKMVNLGRRGCFHIKRLIPKLAVLVVFGVGMFPLVLLGRAITTLFPHGASPGGVGGLVKRSEVIVHNRSVLLYGPATWVPSKPLPLIVVLHGSGGSNFGIASTTQFHERVNGAVVMYPEMQTPFGQEWGYDALWELAFFRALPHEATKIGYTMNTEQVFVVGHSAGGTMALFLQNNLPEVFGAAAAVEAGVGHLDLWRNQSFGMPVMVVWNHNDEVLQEFGGETLYNNTVQQLQRHNPTGVTPHIVADEVLADTSEIVYAKHLVWPSVGPSPTLEVLSWQSRAPTHNWMNPQVCPGSFDAAAVVWDFFRRMAERPERKGTAPHHTSFLG